MKVNLTPGDYSPQAAQLQDNDCIYGQLGQVNWPPMISALDGVGANPSCTARRATSMRPSWSSSPDQTEGAIVVGVFRNLSAPVWDDFRAAIETYKADPKLNYNSLAGLGTWTAFTTFTKIAETIDGEITGKSFIDAADEQTALDTGGMIGVVDLHQRVRRARRGVPSGVQPQRVLRCRQRRRSGPDRRQGLRHDQRRRRETILTSRSFTPDERGERREQIHRGQNEDL